jgi:hypothetical protein
MYILLLNAVAIKIQFLNFKIDFVCPYFFISIIDADFENTTSKAHVYV